MTQKVPEVLVIIERLAQEAQGRARLKARLDRFATGLVYGAVIATSVVLVVGIATHRESLLYKLPLLALPVALIWALLKKPRTPDAYVEAKRLDRELGLSDALAGGYDLARRMRNGEELPSGPFLELLLRDAEAALKAAQLKRRRAPFNPKRLLLGVAANGVSVLLAFVLPSLGRQPEQALAFDSVQRNEIDKFNDMLAEQIASVESLPADERSALVDKLSALKMSDEERTKITRSGLAKKMREFGIVMKTAEGADAAVTAMAKDQMEAILAREQIDKQCAEVDAINSKEVKLALENGKTATADTIKVMQAEKNLTADAALKAALGHDEGAKALFESIDAEKAAALAQQRRTEKFRAKNAPAMRTPASDSEKISSAIMTNQNMQDKVKDALTNPNSTERKSVNEMYRQTLDKDVEGLPPGMARQLKTYINEQTK